MSAVGSIADLLATGQQACLRDPRLQHEAGKADPRYFGYTNPFIAPMLVECVSTSEGRVVLRFRFRASRVMS